MNAASMPAAAISAQRQAIGRIVSAGGAQIVMLLEPTDDDTPRVKIGDLVKIQLARSTVFGIVGGVTVPVPSATAPRDDMKIADVVLVGEIVDPAFGGTGAFIRGVAQMPSIEDDVILADAEDTRLVYALPGRQTVRLGALHHAPQVPAEADVDELLGKHFAIVGTTGTGKSSAVALLLRGILEKHQAAHIVLLDPHGEYGDAFSEQAEQLSVATLNLPYWIFNFEELAEVFFGSEAKEAASEVQILRDLIVAAKQRFAANVKSSLRNRVQISADTPIPYTVGDLSRALDEAVGKLDNRADVTAYLRIRSRLASLQADRRYSFMFPSGLAISDNLAQILGRIFRVPVAGRPLSILDLSGVPSEVLNVVVSVVARMAFDFALCSGQTVPLLLVCEEAHRYAPNDSREGFEPTRRALARIAREGRKYGIGLCIVTQRPSELATTLLSQCSTVFAMRMTNDRDQAIIQAALTESSSAFLGTLPILGNAEAIVTGEGVALPMRVHFTQLLSEHRPRSETAAFSKLWKMENPAAAGAIAAAIDLWRHQKIGEI